MLKRNCLKCGKRLPEKENYYPECGSSTVEHSTQFEIIFNDEDDLDEIEEWSIIEDEEDDYIP